MLCCVRLSLSYRSCCAGVATPAVYQVPGYQSTWRTTEAGPRSGVGRCRRVAPPLSAPSPLLSCKVIYLLVALTSNVDKNTEYEDACFDG